MLDVGEVAYVRSVIAGELSEEGIRGLEHACAPIGTQSQEAA